MLWTINLATDEHGSEKIGRAAPSEPRSGSGFSDRPCPALVLLAYARARDSKTSDTHAIFAN